MSTEIKSNGTETLVINRAFSGVNVWLDISDGRRTLESLFPISDFLAAVATECNVRIVPADAIVIERGELPEVRVDGKWASVGGETYAFAGAAEHRAYAAQHLALAAYLDANPPKPPVDEAMIWQIARELGAEGLLSKTFTDIARTLYLAGVRIEAAK